MFDQDEFNKFQSAHLSLFLSVDDKDGVGVLRYQTPPLAHGSHHYSPESPPTNLPFLLKVETDPSIRLLSLGHQKSK